MKFWQIITQINMEYRKHGNVYNALEKHGEKKYYIYKLLCKSIGKIFKNDKKRSSVKWIIRKTYYLKKLIKFY